MRTRSSLTLVALLVVSLGGSVGAQAPVFRRRRPPVSDPPVGQNTGLDLCYDAKVHSTVRGAMDGAFVGGGTAVLILLGNRRAAAPAAIVFVSSTLIGAGLGYYFAPRGEQCQHDRIAPPSEVKPPAMQDDTSGVRPKNPEPPNAASSASAGAATMTGQTPKLFPAPPKRPAEYLLGP